MKKMLKFSVTYTEEYRNHPDGICGSYGTEAKFFTFAEAVEYVRKNAPKKILPIWTYGFYTISISGIGTDLYKYSLENNEETFSDNETFVSAFNLWHSAFGNKHKLA